MWEKITVEGELAADSGGDTTGFDAGVEGSVGLLVDVDKVSSVPLTRTRVDAARHGTLISNDFQ